MMAKLAKRVLLTVVSLALLGYLATCLYLYQEQRHNIFMPAAELQTTPDRVGMPYEVVHIPSGSGSERGEMYGWWIPAEQPNAPTILYLHGNDMNISGIQDIAHAFRLHGLGYNLLMMDYRGYGKSTGGEPSEAKVYEDAEAAWDYLDKRLGSSKRIFIYGHSLGGAIGIELAIHHPEAAGLIAESTFTTMTDMGKRQFKYLPVELLLNQYFDSLHKVDKLKIPVLYIHGTKDSLIPYKMSERLFEKTPQPKFLKLIEGGGHGNSSLIGWVEYRDAFSAFVKKYAH
jgi:pimeloyl-ACP methyl ester carboxylesterase